MKNKLWMSVALALTVVLALVGVSVWAGPGRQGTVPIPEDEVDLLPNQPASLGTVEITCECVGKAFRIDDPEEDFGPPPEGKSFLADAVTVLTTEGCEVQVCYPYPKEVEDKEAEIYKWDEEEEEWVVVESTISGIPRRICALDDEVTEDTFVLIGEE